jgi:hypothetical protein
MIRENSASAAKESSFQRCDSPKNFAIQKLEEVLESLKQQQIPPFNGSRQTTPPAVPASFSPARKPWFFRNNNKEE